MIQHNKRAHKKSSNRKGVKRHINFFLILFSAAIAFASFSCSDPGISKSNRADLNVSYSLPGGNIFRTIAPSSAGIFTIPASRITAFPLQVNLTLRVYGLAKLYQGTTLLSGGDSIPYTLSFTNVQDAFSFAVEAEDGTKKQYTIVVNVKNTSDKEILGFSFRAADNPFLKTDAIGSINQDQRIIFFQLPAGTDVSKLKPTITFIGDNVIRFIGGNALPAIGEQDFTTDVEYTVTAENGSKQVYLVSVSTRTLTAADSVSVAFDANGASPVAAQRVRKGYKAKAPNAPLRNDGSYFAGWFTDADLTNAFNFDSLIRDNIDLYAGWAKAFGEVILSGKIPANAATSTDPLIKDIFGNYIAGATVTARYVKTNGNGNGIGNWSKAAANIKTVLDNINDASRNKIYVILVAGSNDEYAAGASISMKNNIAIVGGFSARNAIDYSIGSSPTTLSGEDNYRVFDNSPAGDPLDTSSLLYGLRITKGKSADGDYGGGMYNRRSSVKLINIIFSGNSAYNGGAMCNIVQSSPLLKNVVFSRNTSQNDGGGMYNSESSPLLINCAFHKNATAQGNGGGMYNSESTPILANVTFFDNRANDRGGAMFNIESSPIVINSTFSANSASAIAVQGGSSISNAISNSASHLIIANSILAKQENATNVPLQDIFMFRGTEQNNTLVIANSVLEEGGARLIIKDTDTSGAVYTIDNEGPSALLQAIDEVSGFVPVMPILENSSAVDKGLFVRFSPPQAYFSEDNNEWFTVSIDGNKTIAAPPSIARSLTDTDARGRIRSDRPDAGAYEYEAP